jgi:hypothetical protein
MVDRGGCVSPARSTGLTATGASARTQTRPAAGDGNHAASNPDEEDVMTDVLTGRPARSAGQQAPGPLLSPHPSEAGPELLRWWWARLGVGGRRLSVVILVAGAIVLTPVLVGSAADLIERARAVVPWLLAQLQDLVCWAGGWLIPILVGLLVIEHTLRDRGEDG